MEVEMEGGVEGESRMGARETETAREWQLGFRIPCTHVIHVNWYSEGLARCVVYSVSLENSPDLSLLPPAALKPDPRHFSLSRELLQPADSPFVDAEISRYCDDFNG